MKDLLAYSPFAMLGMLTNDQLTFWERMAEKWGIGLVGIGLFLALAWWTNKREAEARATREARENADGQERKQLLSRNNELMEAQIKLTSEHATRIERIAKDGNRAADNHSAALRMMLRKMHTMPCVAKLDEADLEDILKQKQEDHNAQ